MRIGIDRVDGTHDPGDCARQQPGPDAVKILPRYDTGTEREAVRGFQILKGLVGMDDIGLGRDDPQARGEGQQHDAGEGDAIGDQSTRGFASIHAPTVCCGYGRCTSSIR